MEASDKQQQQLLGACLLGACLLGACLVLARCLLLRLHIIFPSPTAETVETVNYNSLPLLYCSTVIGYSKSYCSLRLYTSRTRYLGLPPSATVHTSTPQLLLNQLLEGHFDQDSALDLNIFPGSYSYW